MIIEHQYQTYDGWNNLTSDQKHFVKDYWNRTGDTHKRRYLKLANQIIILSKISESKLFIAGFNKSGTQVVIDYYSTNINWKDSVTYCIKLYSEDKISKSFVHKHSGLDKQKIDELVKIEQDSLYIKRTLCVSQFVSLDKNTVLYNGNKFKINISVKHIE